MATTVQPFAPWMRDLSRFMNTPGAVSAFLPPADVLVYDDAVMVYMDVPGLRAEDLDIELEKDMLSVRGERRPPWESLDGCTARIERAFGRFERTLRVTSGLDANAIEAGLSDGVLTLRLPKPTEVRPRRIEIKQAGATGDCAGSGAPERSGAPEVAGEAGPGPAGESSTPSQGEQAPAGASA